MAVAPERTVTFESNYTIIDSPNCGDAEIGAQAVGRITDMTWSNADGTDLRFAEHYAAVRSTFTNTQTGATLTTVSANLERDHLILGPDGFTLTVDFTGLNFKVAGTKGPPIVSAGHTEITVTGTYELVGDEIQLVVIETRTVTPNMKSLTRVLCG